MKIVLISPLGMARNQSLVKPKKRKMHFLRCWNRSRIICMTLPFPSFSSSTPLHSWDERKPLPREDEEKEEVEEKVEGDDHEAIRVDER
jgi:hypothetical protein